MSQTPIRLTRTSPLLCLKCRDLGRVSALRGGTDCPGCGGTRFLHPSQAPSAFTVIDLAAHPRPEPSTVQSR